MTTMSGDPPPRVEDLGIAGVEDAVRIGRGGFAIVYRAREPAFNRTVAVKLITQPVVDDETRSLYTRELHAMGSLTGHPNIVTVFSSGFTADQRPYMVLEYLTGGSLRDRIDRHGAMPWPEALTIGVRLAEALQAAHTTGVLHRDVKPENVLMSAYGQPKLADFGIARIEGGVETRTGAHLSVDHAAPELFGDEGRPSVQSDVYALASTIVTLILGRPPFAGSAGSGLAARLFRMTTEPPPDLRPLGVPDLVCGVLERGMAKDPAARPSSAAAFAWDLHLAAPAVAPRPSIPPPGASGMPVSPPPAPPPGLPATPTIPTQPDAVTATGPGPPVVGGRRRTLLLVAGIVGVVAVLAAVLAVVLTRPGGSTTPTGAGASATSAATSSGGGGLSVPGASGGSATTTGTVDGAMRAALLAASDLGGFQPGLGLLGVIPQQGLSNLTFCNSTPDLSQRTGEADLGFNHGDEGPFVNNAVARFSPGRAQSFLDAVAGSVGCGTYTDELGNPVQVKRVDGSNLGDQTVRIQTSVQSAIGPSTDLYILVRKGDLVTMVDYSTLGTDTSAAEAIGQKAAQKLR